MDKNSRTGGESGSDTGSTNSHNPKHATSNEARMLTPSERELLQLKQAEVRFVALAHRVFNEAKLAYKAWAHWIAIRDNSVDTDRNILPALHAKHIGGEIGFVHRVIVRDAMLRAYKLSEPVQRSQEVSRHIGDATLCNLALELENSGLLHRLKSQSWVLERGANTLASATATGRNSELVSGFTRFVVSNWTDREPERSKSPPQYA
jgi:hypothetical protein